MIARPKLPIIKTVSNFAKQIDSWGIPLRFICMIFGILAVTACSSNKTDVKFSPFQDKILGIAEKNVRTAKIYRDLDTILIADVLWFSPDIKKAYVFELRKKSRMDKDEEKTRLAEIELKGSEEIEFLMGIYTGEKSWNDFNKPGSIWKLRLVTPDGSSEAPIKIEKIDLDQMPDSYFFPFLSEWKSVYRVIFKKSNKLARIVNPTMLMYSILGETKFRWEGES